jgi:RNA polymerase sigma-70 factor (ECF subfamily)
VTASELRNQVFERLFRDTRTDLLAYVLRRSRTAEDAADVFAETYLVAWRKVDAIPAGDRARPWLFGVARNVLLRGATHHRSDRALVDRLASELRAVLAANPPVDRDRSDALRAALATLPEVDREIVTLSAWEGLTPREIAAVVARPPNVVRVRLHRARARLRQELGPSPPRDRPLGNVSGRAEPVASRASARQLRALVPRIDHARGESLDA